MSSEEDEPEVEPVASATCPHCGAVTSFPGFDSINVFICPQCGEPVDLSGPVN